MPGQATGKKNNPTNGVRCGCYCALFIGSQSDRARRRREKIGGGVWGGLPLPSEKKEIPFKDWVPDEMSLDKG